MDVISVYHSAILALGALAILMFVQLLVADIVGIINKHIPGSVIPTDHQSLLFRVSRTMANTNESLGLFIVAFIFALLSKASADWMAYFAWGFVIARCVYAAFYYFNLKVLRSVSFGFILLAIAGLLVSGLVPWFD